ncbi:unnamed protein product [Calypogeia fissa]
MGDEKRDQQSNASSKSIAIPTTKEADEEPVGYHVSSSLSRRGPLWPQTFGSQMDAKICSSSRRRSGSGLVDTQYVGSPVHTSDSIRGVAAADGTDSDLTEPLLGRNGDDKAPSWKKSGSTEEDLEASYRMNWDSLSTRGSEPSHLSGGPGNQASFGDPERQEEEVHSGSSFLQATLNGVNVLAGVGILSTPYALAQGGWLSMVFLLLFAVICLYTGILLRRCLDTDSAILTYPDMGQAAFGRKGRLLVSVLLYFELYCVTVEFLILEGDNLASLFPLPSSTIGGFSFTPQQVYIVVSALCMLPTLWLRDLSLLAYISAGGVVASVAIVFAVGYAGAFDGIGFHHTGTLINVSGLPVAVGVYAFCFCGHAVFPSIYRSMKHRADFSKVLLVCFVIVTIIYAGIGVLGYTMFGNEVESQVTLNLPKDYLSSRVAIWITLVSPFSKFALTITPLAVALEEFIPWSPKSRQYFIWGNVIRTGLVVSTVAVALLVPFFGYMMAFIGSFLSVSVAVILPCLCHLKIFGGRSGISSSEYWLQVVILFVGVVTAFVGTYSSISAIVGSFDVTLVERFLK